MTKEQQAIIAEIVALTSRLRAYGKNLEGDGFGKVGDLKAAVKRTCVRLEEVVDLIGQIPMECEWNTQDAPNPDCLGNGGDNTPGCTCRLVFNSINRKNQ